MMWESVILSVALWASCIIYLHPLKHRKGYGKRLLLATAITCVVMGLSILFLKHFSAFDVPPYLQGAVIFPLCCLFIYTCASMSFSAAVYCATWAVITQQMAHEFSYILVAGNEKPLVVIAGILATYGVIYAAVGFTIVRYMPEDGEYLVGPRQLSSALCLLIVFEILFEFLKTESGTRIQDVHTWNILLVQFYCVMILYLQNTLFKKSAMKQELDTLNQLWHQQKAQYDLSRETIALINHKCHDLKHQIAAMRAITSPEERDRYLREIEDSVQIYDSIVKTGNEVLDTVLTEKSLFCAANNIKINCIADGHQMDLFDPVDLYTVFGNAIDNAIEGVGQLDNQEMRLIDVLVYVRRQFLMINIMNPMGCPLEFDGNLPVTTKARNGYHGFGLKSIRFTLQRYNGFMKIDTEENIFSLKMLIPLNQS